MSLRTLNLLTEIRPSWMSRISHELARGAGVRESFVDQLNRFYDALLQSVETGDPGWMKPVFNDWSGSLTESDLGNPEANLSPILSQIMNETMRYCHENLPSEDGLIVVAEITPLFTFGFEHMAKRENQFTHRTCSKRS